MNILLDCITYVRRIIKSPSNEDITDDLILDYLNRFIIMDVDARVQLFDMKKTYRFQTTPGVDKYNMPLYSFQTQQGNQTVGMYPVYQGFVGPAYINGVQVRLETQKDIFFNTWQNITQNVVTVAQGDGTVGPYTFTLPFVPNNINPPNPPYASIIRGHIDTSGIIATGQNLDPPIATDAASFATLLNLIPTTSIESAVYIMATAADGTNITVADSGVFLTGNQNYGLLMQPGPAPYGNDPLPGTYSTTSNTINYFNGQVTVTMPRAVPVGTNISVQCTFFQSGLPREILFYNNVLTLRMPPATQYLVELDAYLSPAAFLATNEALPFGYMSEYFARGAARKLLSDTGDVEQFQFYEPLFREQEQLVWKRSQRQFTATRTQTLYSMGPSGQNNYNQSSFGG